VLFDVQATRGQHALNGIERRGMIVALTALLADFSFDIVYEIKLLSEPMDLADLLPDRLAPAELTNHNPHLFFGVDEQVVAPIKHQLANPLQGTHPASLRSNHAYLARIVALGQQSVNWPKLIRQHLTDPVRLTFAPMCI
jgi:hypothetical protein